MGDGGVSKPSPESGSQAHGGFIISVTGEPGDRSDGRERLTGGDGAGTDSSFGSGVGDAGPTFHAASASWGNAGAGGGAASARRSWLFWPVAILGAGLGILLITLVLIVVIPIAILVIVLGLIRRWIRGFLPARVGRVSSAPVTDSHDDDGDDNADLRRNVRVISRD